jgi:hypothetical protein
MVAMLFVVTGMQAQNARLAEIRKMYAAAKQEIENVKKLVKEGQPGNEMVVNNNLQMPGSGPSREEIHYYYHSTYDEVTGTPVYVPYFISRKYNIAANNFYQEFLFDKNGEAVFCFLKSGESDETRYYWGADGFSHEMVKGGLVMDVAFAHRLVGDLKDAFDKLVNREY